MLRIIIQSCVGKEYQWSCQSIIDRHDVEHQGVIECGGYIEDGYLNGVLSVTRALGDWDMKLPQGSPSPLSLNHRSADHLDGR
jgi:hypothetical protein